MAGRPKAQTNNGDRNAISLTKKVEPEMLLNVYVDKQTQRVDPRYGRDFVIDKWVRATLDAVPNITLEEWNIISTEMFQRFLDKTRDKKAAAAQAVLDKAADDPELLAALEVRIAELKAQRDSRQSDRGRSARQEAVAV